MSKGSLKKKEKNMWFTLLFSLNKVILPFFFSSFDFYLGNSKPAAQCSSYSCSKGSEMLD